MQVHYMNVMMVWAYWMMTGCSGARISPGDWSGGLPDYAYTSDSWHISDVSTLAFINYSYYNANKELVSKGGEDGKYGEGKIMDFTGVVVHIYNTDNEKNHTGCNYDLFDGKFPENGVAWIALIQRGGCNFEDKVKNAYRKKASGVLIYNDKDSKTLDKMKLIDKNRNISAVFTYREKGEEIARLVDNGTEVILNVSIGSRHYRTSSNMNRTSVLFVSISFILLMIMSISWLIFYYIQRFRYMHAKDKLSKRLCSAAKKALSKIPVKNLKVEDREIQGDGECCAVCIEPYKLSDVLRILPCRHDFHKSCIDPWLLEHRTCPMCKMDILKYYGFVFTGSQESILQLDMEEGERRTPNTNPTTPNHHIPTESSSYDFDHSERSSRASSPDELIPSLHSSPHMSSHHHRGTPHDKRLQDTVGQSSFYIKSEKQPRKNSFNKNSTSEPTSPSKSCISIRESVNSASVDNAIQEKDSRGGVLPRVHSSPSCSRPAETIAYTKSQSNYAM